MIELLDSLTEWYWLGFGVILIIFEVLLGTSFFLLYLGLCAIALSILLWIFPELPWEYQLLIFGLSSIVSVFLWNVYLKKYPTKTDRPNLNRRGEQYIGRTFTLSEPIVNGRGKIKVDDSIWRVEGVDQPVGSKVKAIGLNGTIIQVESVN